MKPRPNGILFVIFAILLVFVLHQVVKECKKDSTKTFRQLSSYTQYKEKEPAILH